MADILHQFIVKSKPGKVFEAFTSSEGLNNWWPLESSGNPEINTAYRFYFGPQYDWRANVIHVVPGKELTWQMTEAMEDWLPTQVGFVLNEHGDGCLVNFFHKSWPSVNDHFAISNFCWGQLLQGLKNYVEKGEVIPFEKRN